MSQTKTEETKSDVAKNGMAVVACIDAMFNTHTHTPLEYHGKITSLECHGKGVMDRCHGNREVCSVMERRYAKRYLWSVTE